MRSEHYVTGGDREKLEALAGALRDEPIRLSTDLVTQRPWERVAAFSLVAACADLLVDEDARSWCAAALREITDHPDPVGPAAPNPWLAAFRAFGQLASCSTEEQARQFLGISADLLPREANRYRFTDEDHVRALIGIARAHPSLRDEAVEHLIQAILLDQRMAELALSVGADLLRDDPDHVGRIAAEPARAGNYYGALALVVAEADTDAAEPVARQRFEAAIVSRVHEPGVRTFGTDLAQSALLVTALPEDDRVRFARAMIEFAEDEEETSHNRVEALVALRAIAGSLPDDVHDELFYGVLPFAQGQRQATPADADLDIDDPLQRFRFSLGDAPLAPTGVQAAAALARTAAQREEVQRLAVDSLRGATEHTMNAIAAALALLPATEFALPLEVLAAHPSRWMRALGAVIWAHRPDEPEEIGLALAEDPSSDVRLSLARNLGDSPRAAKVREVLAADPRRSVRGEV